MFKLLRSLVGPGAGRSAGKPAKGSSESKDASARTRTTSAPARPASAGSYHAVSLILPSRHCAVAESSAKKKWLSKEAPDLPLAGCTMAKECTCKFRKHADRRENEDRRLLGSGETARWYSGAEKRTRGRRKTDG
jgi:hypothetical protein